MQQVAGFPYFELEFDRHGAPHEAAAADALVQHVTDAGVTDLIMLSHGWNNDMAEARTLYATLLTSMAARIAAAAPGSPLQKSLVQRRFAVMAVLWPSKKFADRDLIPTGAASLGGGDELALVEQLETLADTADSPEDAAVVARARALIPKLEQDAAARRDFVACVRSLLEDDAVAAGPPDANGITDPASPQDTAAELNADQALFDEDGDALLRRLGRPAFEAPVSSGGGASGGAAGGASGGAAGGWAPPSSGGGMEGQAAGIGSFFSGARTGARNLLNYGTYYKMKGRAGTVGAGGVHDVLRRVRAAAPNIRLHLVGHSFGGRLVASCAAAERADRPPLVIDSLSLLQAAFSHHAFASRFDGNRDGAFRALVTDGRVRGPVIITHTVNDKAVGVAYPLASMLARQDAAGVGDESSRWGGMGRNGAVKTPEAVAGELLGVDDTYTFTSGRIHNLRADRFVRDHGDVAGGEVAHGILAAIASVS